MPIPAIVATLLPLAGDLLRRWFPDPLEAKKKEQELLGVLLSSDLSQLEVNKAEALHRSIFVAGWRPFIGWTCGLSLAYQFVVTPLAAWCLTMWSPGTPLPVLPEFVTSNLFELVLAMLGLGGLRTFEKLKGLTA